MPLHPSRRKFVQDAGLASIALSLSPQFIKAQSSAKKDIIKIGVIGTGFRGQSHVELLVQRPDVVVVAFADPDEKMLADAQNILKKAGKTAAIEYKNGKEDYKNLLKSTDIDAVIIASPWEWHIPQAIEAIQNGIIPGVEVCGAINIKECWDVVNASEKYNIPVMCLENVCYRRDVLAVYNMVRKGMFG